MQNRSFSVGGKYRYGFNTQEQEPELGSGVTSAEFWMYDGKLGRRWNVDSVFVTSLSSYCTFANNPNLFTDHMGDKFKIPKDDKQAKIDVQSLAKTRNHNYIKFNEETGEVTVEFGDLSQKKIDRILKKDKGLNLIRDLSLAKDSKGKDLNFFYGTQGETGIGLEYPQKQTTVFNYYSNISTLDNKGGIYKDDFGGYNPKAFVLNASKNFYSSLHGMPDSGPDDYGLKPLDDYDGKVFIGRGTFKITEFVNDYSKPILDKNKIPTGYYEQTEVTIIIKRSEIVRHELNENLLRTLHGYCYKEAHLKAGGTGNASRFYPSSN